MLTNRRHIALMTGSMVFILLMLSTLTVFAQISPDVQNVLQIVTREADIDWENTGILWLTGDPKNYSLDLCEKLKDWARTGRVAWIDISVVPIFGMTDVSGGGTKRAVPAPGAMGHPLLEDVSEVQCMDTWYYLKDLPADAVPILAADNRKTRTVIAIWPLEKGFILFRPEARPENLIWQSSTKRRWIVPDLVDGGVFIRNIYNISIATLAESGFIAPNSDRKGTGTGCKGMMGVCKGAGEGCKGMMGAEGKCPMKGEGACGCPMCKSGEGAACKGAGEGCKGMMGAESKCPMKGEGACGCPMCKSGEGACKGAAEGCKGMMGAEGKCPMKGEGACGCPMCKKMKHMKPKADAVRGLREAFDAVLPASGY